MLKCKKKIANYRPFFLKYVLTQELRVVKGLVTMAQGPINLSLFGLKVARGTPNRVFAFFFFFLLKKCLETNFTVKVNDKNSNGDYRPFNGHLQIEGSCAYIYLPNAHAFCAYCGVISGVLTTC